MTRHDDDGIATIFVVLMMPLLILFGALVFDGGRGYLARRQTQNAADSGALAKATDCALQRSATVFTAYETNGAKLSNSPTCGSGTTTVSMSRNISFVFKPGGGGGTVTRSATAKWGTIGTATTLPITISSCEFTQALLVGTTDIVIYLDDTNPQTGCSSLPGGFSQLKDDDCALTIIAGGMVVGDPGGDIMKVVPCITNSTPPALPHDVLIPMYDAAACQAAGCKGQGPYKILGFVTFTVKSYSFNGNNYAGSLGNKCPDKTRGKYCILGDYIPSVQGDGTPGPSTDFGTYKVYLSS